MSDVAEVHSSLVRSRRDGMTRAIVRVEQRALRRARFGNLNVIGCAICGRVLPVELVRLAHIKLRAEANRAERLMLANTIPACTLGCDELFERGYLVVGPTGSVMTNPAKAVTGDLQKTVSRLADRRIDGHRPEQEPFFRWHRDRHTTGM